ncbi:MAG: hypothetical protein FK734_05905 [Asgard group archaeon]|nr:hypothetical protein [Asgard group archaeon]
MGKVNVAAVVILSILLAASLVFTIIGLTVIVGGCGLGIIYFIPGLVLTIVFSILLAVIIVRGKKKGKEIPVVSEPIEKPITDY